MVALSADNSSQSNLNIYENIYSREPGIRDFSSFPSRELATLVDIIEQGTGDEELKYKLDSYFKKLNFIGAEPEVVALIGHAIASYLRKCIEHKEPWSSQFLFPPTLNPKEMQICVDDDTRLATDHFRISN